MPRRELQHPRQVEEWLEELAANLTSPAEMILIGSGGLLWHAFQHGITEPLPEKSMDVDPISNSDEVVEACYQAIIGSDFERTHGWHVNLMPDHVLRELPQEWQSRASAKQYQQLRVLVPSVVDLLVPKLKRNEPRDRSHEAWARSVNLLT
jgi:hypothetical protein